MKKTMIFSVITFVFLALMIACSSGGSTSSGNNDSGNNGNTGILTGIVRAYKSDSGSSVSPRNVYEANGFFVFATGEWDLAHWPGGKDSYSGTARLIRVLDISSFPVSFTDYPDVIVSEMVKLTDGYLIVGRSTKGETDKGYAAVLSQGGELLSDFEYGDEFQGYANFGLAAATSDGYLLNNFSKFVCLGTDLTVKWERDLTDEDWDPGLNADEDLSVYYRGDMKTDVNGDFVILMGVTKYDGVHIATGYSLLKMNGQGEIQSAQARYPQELNTKIKPHQVLLKNDGTMILSYTEEVYDEGSESTSWTGHVALLDAVGDTIWDYDQGSGAIAMAADGSVYTAWATDATNPAHPNNILTHLHVAKLTPQGELVWSKVYEHLIDYIEPSAICLSADGGIVIAGKYVDHNVTGTDDEQGVLLIKLDDQGNCPDCN
ncbi:MAG: hypothetical protein KAH24_09300 [Holophagae bacterium]|nr:hypothetical protein [Holophagae bacterium]